MHAETLWPLTCLRRSHAYCNPHTLYTYILAAWPMAPSNTLKPGLLHILHRDHPHALCVPSSPLSPNALLEAYICALPQSVHPLAPPSSAPGIDAARAARSEAKPHRQKPHPNLSLTTSFPLTTPKSCAPAALSSRSEP